MIIVFFWNTRDALLITPVNHVCLCVFPRDVWPQMLDGVRAVTFHLCHRSLKIECDCVPFFDRNEIRVCFENIRKCPHMEPDPYQEKQPKAASAALGHFLKGLDSEYWDSCSSDSPRRETVNFQYYQGGLSPSSLWEYLVDCFICTWLWVKITQILDLNTKRKRAEKELTSSQSWGVSKVSSHM